MGGVREHGERIDMNITGRTPQLIKLLTIPFEVRKVA